MKEIDLGNNNICNSNDIKVSVDLCPRPKMMLNIDGIPQSLKNINRWMLWTYSYDVDKDEWFKDIKWEWKDPTKLLSFDEVIKLRNNDPDTGIGFVFSNDDDIIGIDIDKCFSVNKVLTEDIKNLIFSIGTYTEVSPSTYGLHVIGRVKDKSLFRNMNYIKHGGCDHLEISVNKLFTITGLKHKELPIELMPIDEEKLKNIIKVSVVNEKEPFITPIEIIEGGRNNLLTQYAGRMRRAGAAKAAILAAIKEENRLRCVPPLNDTELEQIASSVSQYKPQDPIIAKNIKIEEVKEVKPIVSEDVVFDIDELPDDNLIKKYVKYGESTQDTYPEYHMINIMSLISTMVVSFSDPVFGKVYNNIWSIVIGQAGISGKSSSISLKTKLKSDININYPIYDMPSKPSPESFIELMADHNNRIMVIDEASGFMKYLKRDYAKELVEYILQTYSHYSISKSTVSKRDKKGEVLSGGVIECKNPHINYLWYTTPTAFTSNVDRDNYLNGFYQRAMYIYATRLKEVKKDRALNDTDTINYNEIVDRCIELMKLTQNKYIVFNENEIINTWKYEKRVALSKETTMQEEKGSAISRNSEHVRKIAMILTLGSKDFITQLEKRQIEDATKVYASQTININIPDWAAYIAIKWADNFMENYLKIYKMCIVNNDGLISKIRIASKQSDDNGWINRSYTQDIIKRYGRSFDEIISDLIGEGKLDQKIVKTGGRQATMYKWIGD